MKVSFKNLNFEISFQTLIITVLVAVILLMRNCSGPITPTEPRIERDTVVEYVTIEKEVPVYKPQIRTVIKTRIDTFTTPIDTAAILADYYAVKTYEDTQVLDSLDITITDTVSQNQILGRKIAYNFTYPRSTITEKIYLNQRELYYGIGLGGGAENNYFGGELLFRNKKNQAYGLGVGINSKFQPAVIGRIYWKLGK